MEKELVIEKNVLIEAHDNEVIELPNDIEVIGRRAFMNHKVKSIILPETLKIIDEEAFYNCEDLIEINLPSKLEVIKKGAFIYCKKLEKVFIPNSVKIIEKDAFKNCPRLEIFCEGEIKEGWVEKIEVEERREECYTPDDDAFNFHRSSGSWTSHVSYVNVEHKISWNPDKQKVHTNYKRK